MSPTTVNSPHHAAKAIAERLQRQLQALVRPHPRLPKLADPSAGVSKPRSESNHAAADSRVRMESDEEGHAEHRDAQQEMPWGSRG